MSWLLLRRPVQAAIRSILISVFTFNAIVGWSVAGWILPAQSQLPSMPTASSHDLLNPPSGVTRYGEYETAPVKSPLDNKILFEVASPTIFNRNSIPEGKMPVEIRVEEVNQRLWRVFTRTLEAKQTPTVAIAKLNNRFILQISDDRFSRPVRLVTVTEPDSDYHGKLLKDLAQEWHKILQDEIARFKKLASPGVLRQRLGQSLQILLGLSIVSVILWLLRRLLTRRQQTLEARYQQELAAIATVAETRMTDALTQASAGSARSETTEDEEAEARKIAARRSQFLATLQHQFSLKRRLDIDKFLKWALLWIFILMWYIGIYQIMSRVPILMRWSGQVLATPLVLILLWFAIGFAIRIGKSSTDRFMHSWRDNPYLPLGEAQRLTLRTTTIAEALKGFITFVLVITGIIGTLSLFDIPTTSILAGGAIVGLAISFGSQSLIKDLVNGCLILIEDQFAVGDVIQIDDKSGLVENLNLRVTQLRNGEGQLITIPNSNITNVRNLTRLWSRVDFSIVVAYENDPKQVLEILRQVSQELYSEPEWRGCLTGAPEVLGIDALSHAGMLMRVWIKTAPMEQWSVGREFRLRVRLAFEANNIQIGRPEWIVYNTNLVNSEP